MIYLAGAIASNICMTFVMKYSESHGGNRYALNIWNYLAGTIFSFLLLESKFMLFTNGDGFTLGLSTFNGLLYVLGLIAMQVSIARNGAPLTATFTKLGILIPTIVSALLFAEIPGTLQIIGLSFSIFAIIYMNGGAKEERPSFMLGLILNFLIGGTVDTISKIYSRGHNSEQQTIFVMYTFLFALLVSTFFFLRSKTKMSCKDALFGICCGIPNQLTTLFLLRAASGLPAYIVYPTCSAGVILFVNIINYLVFKEKLTKRQYAATGFIGLALIFLNL